MTEHLLTEREEKEMKKINELINWEKFYCDNPRVEIVHGEITSNSPRNDYITIYWDNGPRGIVNERENYLRTKIPADLDAMKKGYYFTAEIRILYGNVIWDRIKRSFRLEKNKEKGADEFNKLLTET
jgi:hypothetical protein